MSRPRRIAYGPGLLALIGAAALITASLRTSAARDNPDPPSASLGERIVELNAQASLLEVECAASRENLLESSKKLGKLRLGDNQATLRAIKREFEELKHLGMRAISMSGKDPAQALEELRTSIQGSADAVPKEQLNLASRLFDEGPDAEKATARIAEIELKLRIDAASAEADRMRTDFLDKCRLLHRKKQELAEAEAKHRPTK